jgi:hypothetical protein
MLTPRRDHHGLNFRSRSSRHVMRPRRPIGQPGVTFSVEPGDPTVRTLA